MLQRTVASAVTSGFALSALLLAAPLAHSIGGDGTPHKEESVTALRGKAEALLTQFLADVESETTYECNGKCSEEGCTEECPYMTSPRVQLTSMISMGPSGIEALKPLAVDAIGAKATTEAQSQALVWLLLESRNAAVVPVAEAMFSEKPEAFCCDGLTGFCEMGSESMRAPLAKRVKKGEAGVAAAAFLATQDVHVGKKMLIKAAMPGDISTENALDALVSASVVEAHYGKKGLTDATRARVHRATLAALDAGELKTARHLAVAAQIAHGASMTSKPVYSALGWKQSMTLEKCEKAGKLATADEIFELIEELTPIG